MILTRLRGETDEAFLKRIRDVNKALGIDDGVDDDESEESRAYCPTGPGGGEDNSCSSSGGSGGSARLIPTRLGGQEESWGHSNATEIWTPDRPMFRGAEGISEIMINRPADARGVIADGLKLSVADVVSAAGPVIDGVDRAGISRARMTITPVGDAVSVSWKCVGRATGDGYTGEDKALAPRPGTIVNAVDAHRTIGVYGGRVCLDQDTYFIHPDYQRMGLALESVIRQTSVPGIGSVTMVAGRDDDSPDPMFRMNGYWKWPRYGYNASIDRVRRASLSGEIPHEFRHAASLLDIYSVPGGPEWWKEEGEGITLHFDLRPRSQSRLVLLGLQDYVFKRHGNRSEPMSADDRNQISGDCDNDPDIDAAWASIAKKLPSAKAMTADEWKETDGLIDEIERRRATDGRPPEVRPH